MPQHEVPPGHVLIRLTDLVELLAFRPAQPPEPAGTAAAYAATWDSLAVATSLLTNQLGDHPVSRAGLADGVSPEAVVGALVTVAAAVLTGCLEHRTEDFLQYLGILAAARESTQ